MVTVWNLEERKLHSVLRDAHDGPLVGGGRGVSPGGQAEKGRSESRAWPMFPFSLSVAWKWSCCFISGSRFCRCYITVDLLICLLTFPLPSPSPLTALLSLLLPWGAGANELRTPPPSSQLSLHFFPGEPVLMSSAADNSIKHWIFDGAEDAGRLLRFRSGHSAPPTCILHYGQVGLSGWRGAMCVEPTYRSYVCGGAM